MRLHSEIDLYFPAEGVSPESSIEQARLTAKPRQV